MNAYVDEKASINFSNLYPKLEKIFNAMLTNHFKEIEVKTGSKVKSSLQIQSFFDNDSF